MREALNSLHRQTNKKSVVYQMQEGEVMKKLIKTSVLTVKKKTFFVNYVLDEDSKVDVMGTIYPYFNHKTQYSVDICSKEINNKNLLKAKIILCHEIGHALANTNRRGYNKTNSYIVRNEFRAWKHAFRLLKSKSIDKNKIVDIFNGCAKSYINNLFSEKAQTYLKLLDSWKKQIEEGV